jgi:hypothetical protein
MKDLRIPRFPPCLGVSVKDMRVKSLVLRPYLEQF